MKTIAPGGRLLVLLAAMRETAGDAKAGGRYPPNQVQCLTQMIRGISFLEQIIINVIQLWLPPLHGQPIDYYSVKLCSTLIKKYACDSLLRTRLEGTNVRHPRWSGSCRYCQIIDKPLDSSYDASASHIPTRKLSPTQKLCDATAE